MFTELDTLTVYSGLKVQVFCHEKKEFIMMTFFSTKVLVEALYLVHLDILIKNTVKKTVEKDVKIHHILKAQNPNYFFL